MRRLLSSSLVAVGMVATGLLAGAGVPAGAGPAAAAPTPDAPPGAGQGAAAKAKPGKKLCRVTDERLAELSGMVATRNGYVVVNDSSDVPSRERVFFLDAKCAVTETVPFTGNGPRDTEDLALSPDGKTLWIADIGDNPNNQPRRNNVALWTMPVDGSKRPVVHRVTYPDGPHDAEALLINGDGSPILVTKEAGRARLYVPSAPLKPRDSAGVPLRLAGEVKVPASTTSNPLLAPGRLIVTGAAQSRDGRQAVLRTYADAFAWDVDNGDVLAALKRPPRSTPLPDEPFGEAITFSVDGKTLRTVSDAGAVDAGVQINILEYVPSAATAKAVQPASAAPPKDGPSWFARLSLQQITYLIGAVGLIGAVLVGLGILGIVLARRRPPTASSGRPASPTKGKPSAPSPGGADAETALLPPVRDEVTPAGSRSGGLYGGGSGVYGGRPQVAAPARSPAAPAPSRAPAARPPGAMPGTGVYGGGSPRVYGGNGQPRPIPGGYPPQNPSGANGYPGNREYRPDPRVQR